MNKCTKCGGEFETLSAMISEDGQQHIKAVKCTQCGHKETLRTKRMGAPKHVGYVM